MCVLYAVRLCVCFPPRGLRLHAARFRLGARALCARAPCVKAVRPHVQTRGPLAYTTKGAAGEQIDLKRAGGRCSGQRTHLWARHRGAGQPRVVKTLSAPSRVHASTPRVYAFLRNQDDRDFTQ